MAAHNDFGKLGEEDAVAYLAAKGYGIRERGWLWKGIDLDIVAETAEEVVVVEVKARHSGRNGDPASAVTERKIKRIVRATEAYIEVKGIVKPVRFDIIEMRYYHGVKPEIRHIEDAFLSPVEGGGGF